MAGSFSDFLEKKILDNIFSQVAMPTIANVFVALLTDSNTATQRDANTVTEVPTGTWTNYARVSVTNNATNFPAASGTLATKNNAIAVSWAAAAMSPTSGTVVVTAVAFYDALSAGNLLGWADLTVIKTVSNGDTFQFAINGLTITQD